MNGSNLISIITPCLNRIGFIEEAVKSVLNQDYPNVEHIIIDGGSTDGTLEILKQFSHLHVVSEPDEGIYDALNKGINLSNGDIIGLLNTDDFYPPDILPKINDAFELDPDIMAVVGSAVVLRKDDPGTWTEVRRIPSIPRGELLNRVTKGPWAPNAWFFRRRVFQEIGYFNHHYQISADADFFIRFALADLPYQPIDQDFYYYQQHPGSLTFKQDFTPEGQSWIENREIAENYLSTTKIFVKDRKIIRSWHSNLTARQFLTALRRQDITSAAIYFAMGIRTNAYWPLFLISRVANSIQYRCRMNNQDRRVSPNDK